jgi:hypothetical protein
MTIMRYSGLLILGVTFASFVLLVLALLEYGLPMYVPVWAYVLVVGCCYAMLFGLLSEHRRWAKFSVLALFTLGVMLVFVDSEDSSQAVMRHLHRVQLGMNVTQVEAIMGRYNRYNALFHIQNTKRLPSGQLVLINPEYAVYKHSTPDDGAYNAAHGTVHFKNGKVTGVSYRGD